MKQLSSQRLMDGGAAVNQSLNRRCHRLPLWDWLYYVIWNRCGQSDAFILKSGLTYREPGVHEGRNICKGLGQWAPSSGQWWTCASLLLAECQSMLHHTHRSPPQMAWNHHRLRPGEASLCVSEASFLLKVWPQRSFCKWITGQSKCKGLWENKI